MMRGGCYFDEEERIGGEDAALMRSRRCHCDEEESMLL
jgi:hypothetical protein